MNQKFLDYLLKKSQVLIQDNQKKTFTRMVSDMTYYVMHNDNRGFINLMVENPLKLPVWLVTRIGKTLFAGPYRTMLQTAQHIVEMKK